MILGKGRWIHSTFPPTTEWIGLDLVKAVGVAVILFVHPHFLLISKKYAIVSPNSTLVELTRDMMFLGTFIMLLPIMAGCALRATITQHIRTDGSINSSSFMRSVFWTAIIMSSLGFLMNAITWGAWYTFSWNMLQMVSVAYLVVAIVVLRFGVLGVLILAIAILFFAQPLVSVLRPYSENYFVGILVGNNTRFIFWPILPWVSLPAIGFVVAHLFLQYRRDKRFLILSLAVGLSFVVIAIIRGEFTAELNNRYVWSQLMHQPLLWEVLGGVGLFLMLICLAEVCSAKITLSRYGVVNSFSKGILWIYIMQMVVSYNLAPLVIDGFDFYQRLEMENVSDAFVYALLPLFMMLLGWATGAGIIKMMQENRFHIRLRKA